MKFFSHCFLFGSLKLKKIFTPSKIMFIVKPFYLQLVMAKGLHPENVAVGWYKILPAFCLASVYVVKKECRLFAA